MFIYNDNAQVKSELKKMLVDCGKTAREIASVMGVKPQQYHNIVNKKNLAFSDVARILDACGYELVIDFKKLEK